MNNETNGCAPTQLNIDKIRRGVVIDHIAAGRSMSIYEHLNLDKLDCSVAIIKNVKSTVRL